MDRLKNRLAATELARQAAMKGNPVCGAYFAAMDEIRSRGGEYGRFLADFADYFDDDDDDADQRPY